MTTPSLPIILVNWNGWRDSIACIRSCLALGRPEGQPPVRIILCDNASSDGSVAQILAWAKGESPPPPAPASPVPLPDIRPRDVALLDRAAAERGDDAGGGFRIGLSRHDRAGVFQRQNRQGAREHLGRLSGAGNDLHRHIRVKPQPANGIESVCRVCPQSLPGGHGNLRAATGGITHRQGKRKGGRRRHAPGCRAY